MISITVDNQSLTVEFAQDAYHIDANTVEPGIIVASIISSILILIVSSLVIQDVLKMPWTFVNFMIFLDSLLSLAHIPILLILTV